MGNIIVHTSYFSKYKELQEYQCISVANSQPGNMCLLKWNDVVPDWAYVNAYKTCQITREQFMELYLNKLNAISDERLLSYLSRFECVVLMCWEKDPYTCHRSALLERLAKIEGINTCGEI